VSTVDVQVHGRPAFAIDILDAALLCGENTKKGRLQRAALALLLEHEATGTVPTNNRFTFYEALQAGVLPGKEYPGNPRRKPAQDWADATFHLRDVGLVPWTWIYDETRSLDVWEYGSTVVDYVDSAIDQARIDCWAGEPSPLILCESRSLAGVLRPLAAEYLCPISSTNGQAGGFLRTDVGPLLEADRTRPVLYLGDFDWQGNQIEANTRRVLEQIVGAPLDWERVALTDVQVRERGLERWQIDKPDHRYKPVRSFPAVETEALGQGLIIEVLRDHLDTMIPQPLALIRERERDERAAVREVNG
jgi:hypothetical protein